MGDQVATLTIRQFQSDIDEIRNAPEPRFAMITIVALAGFVVAVGALLCFAQVDRVVVSRAGRIVPVRPNLNFQALDQSIIKSLDVKEGELVAKGQRLATLDPVFADADVTQLKQQVGSLDAQLARAAAEAAGQDFAPSPSADPDRRRYDELQKQSFAQRQAQYAAQLKSFDQKIGLATATMAKLEADIRNQRGREKIANQLQDIRAESQRLGVGTMVNVLGSTDARLELQRTIELGHNSLVEAERQRDSLKADREAFVQQSASAISLELVTARNLRDTASALLDKALKHQEVVTLMAPEESLVLTVAKISVGSVLKAGDPVMVLVPAKGKVEAEIQISPRDIGFLRPGDRTTLKIDAFNFTEHGTAEGKVQWISEGAFTTDDTGLAVAEGYYKARVSIDSHRFVHVPSSFRLLPGMTLTGDVIVGARSLGAYLISGIVKDIDQSMREP